MNAREKLKRRAEIFVAYSSRAAVRGAARISQSQLNRALGKGQEASASTMTALNELRFAHLEDFAPMVALKGTRLRLQALYATGLSMEALATWDRENKPYQLDRRRLWRYAAETDAGMVTTAFHMWIRKVYQEREQIPATRMDEACVERAHKRGWLRPIDLEEDLIDMPEPWAGELLRARVEDMKLEELRNALRGVQAGDRGQLMVEAAAECKKLDNQRRAENLRKQRIAARKQEDA